MEEDFSTYPKTRKEAKELGSMFYFLDKVCPHGHNTLRYTKTKKCKDCSSIRNKSEKTKRLQKQWREKNKESEKERGRIWYENNKEYKQARNRITTKIWSQNNKEHRVEYSRQYIKKNRDKINSAQRKRFKRKYRTDLNFKANRICRGHLDRVLKALKEGKTDKTFEILNYTVEQFIEDMENKFLDSMSWDNYGEWHIDHIIPISRCMALGITDPSLVNSLENLVPMWSQHNQSKRDKLLSEYLNENPCLYDLYKDALLNEKILKEMADGRA